MEIKATHVTETTSIESMNLKATLKEEKPIANFNDYDLDYDVREIIQKALKNETVKKAIVSVTTTYTLELVEEKKSKSEKT